MKIHLLSTSIILFSQITVAQTAISLKTPIKGSAIYSAAESNKKELTKIIDRGK